VQIEIEEIGTLTTSVVRGLEALGAAPGPAGGASSPGAARLQ